MNHTFAETTSLIRAGLMAKTKADFVGGFLVIKACSEASSILHASNC